MVKPQGNLKALEEMQEPQEAMVKPQDYLRVVLLFQHIGSWIRQKQQENTIFHFATLFKRQPKK